MKDTAIIKTMRTTVIQTPHLGFILDIPYKLINQIISKDSGLP